MGKRLERFDEFGIVDETTGFGLDLPGHCLSDNAAVLIMTLPFYQ